MDLAKFWVIVVFVVCYEQSAGMATSVNALNKNRLGRSRSERSADADIYLALPPSEDDIKTGKQHSPPTLIRLESNGPNKFKGKFPTPIERFIQRIQNYFSVYNPPEYLNDLQTRPGINNPENDGDQSEYSNNNTQVILPCNGTSTIVIIPVPLESENNVHYQNANLQAVPEVHYKEPTTTAKPPYHEVTTKPPCPEVTTPKPNCPEVTTTTPKPNCPEVTTTTPKPNCPEVTTTEKPKCPEVTTPKPNCPEVTTPKPNCPEVTTTQKPKCPEVTTPKPNCPEVTTTTPKPNCPELTTTTPKPNCPEVTTPKPKCPEVTTPKPNCPEVTTPKPNCPEVTTPKPNCPDGTTQKPICPPRKTTHHLKPISGYGGPNEVPPLNLVVQPVIGSTVVYYYKNPTTLPPPIPLYYIPSTTTASPYEEYTRKPKPPIMRLKQLLFPRLYAAFHPED